MASHLRQKDVKSSDKSPFLSDLVASAYQGDGPDPDADPSVGKSAATSSSGTREPPLVIYEHACWR